MIYYDQRNTINKTKMCKVVLILIAIIFFLMILFKISTNSTRNAMLNQIKQEEAYYKMMNNEVYFDYAGSAPYTGEQIKKFTKMMEKDFLCNSHSPNNCGLRSNDILQEMRSKILKYFGTNEDNYIVIFTSGTTQSLRIVGESFPFEEGSHFYFTKSNHNSVLGIREFAKLKKADFKAVDEFDSKILPSTDKPSLFAYPPEDNFNGVQHPLDWVDMINAKKNWYSLIDTAAFVSHNPLDLNRIKPHFVTMSFYKMFGFPMGVGALLMRKDIVPKMIPIYFGGGTVYSSLPEKDYKVFFGYYSKFEAGTLPISSIAALKFGFEMIESKGGMVNIKKRTLELTKKLVFGLKNVKHSNGQNVFEIYGNHLTESQLQGPIVTFNIFKDNGKMVKTALVNAFLRDNNVNIRTGCMCNPGSCLKALKINSEDYMNAIPNQPQEGFDSNSCLDIMIGEKEAGAIRVSFGYASTFEELERFIEVMNDFLKSEKINAKISI